MKHILLDVSVPPLAIVKAVARDLSCRTIALDEGRSAERFMLCDGDIALAEPGEGKETWVTITRAGRFYDERYGDFDITKDMLDNMIRNFSANTYGQKIFIDVAHKPQDGAAGEVIRLQREGTKLRALVRWNPLGVEAVNERGYRYFSIEYADNYVDNEERKPHGATMLGAALCTRPVIKGLDALDRIELSEAPGGKPVLLHPHLETRLRVELQETTMKKEQMIKQLSEKLVARGYSAENAAKIVATATKQLEAITDEAQVKALADAYDQLVEAAYRAGPGQPGAIIQLNTPAITTGLDEAGVLALMEKKAAERAEAEKKLAETITAKRATFAGLINKATNVPEEARKKVLSDCEDLITAEMSDDQIKRLAENQLAHIAAASIATQLVQRGYQVNGSVILSVDESNSVRSLQESIDKRLRLSGQPSAKQLRNLGGSLPPEHKEFIDNCLKDFDAQRGSKLMAEAKALAAGTGSVSDISVPVVWERTVLREQLYELVSLNFVNVGTAPFAEVIRIPYSYRDTTGATRDSVRVYEGGGIPRAGVKQTYDEARPLPQKIAFLISDEMQLLSQNSGLDWEALSENVKNCGRIIGEDTERLLFDEHVRSSDEYAMTAVTNEALTGVNGTNKYFILAQFPVVKPRVIKNLQGVIQSTTAPIVVTYNSVVRSEYDGTGTQAAGLYYVMDYNVGEIYIVSELGAVQTPANATPFTVSYSYTTNVFKFDSDLGSSTTKDKWDDFLYKFGLRKAVIEDQRFFTTDLGLMSGNVRSQIEQAGQFQANFQKPGTSLTASGNLGVIKDVPQYKTICPGLMMGDRRVVLGQRNQIRFRMLKPWAMEQLQPARNGAGLFTAQKEGYGTQWVAVHSPTMLKGSLTTILIYSATARVNRATP